MHVLIAGGSGFLGQKLTQSLVADQHHVSILSRSNRSSGNRLVHYLKWDGKAIPSDAGTFDVIVNLAGASIADKRWTEAYKQQVMDSRVDATRACVAFIRESSQAPKVLISASAVGFYGAERPEKVDETAAPGQDFVAEVCQRWEEEAHKSPCRTVTFRIGVVLGKEGGALPLMMTAYQFMLGGQLGTGKQGFPWVHVDDVVGAMRFAMAQPLEGTFNLAGPEQVSQKAFSDALAQAVKRPAFFVVPKFMLDLALGERGGLLTGGQWPLVDKLTSAGYTFQYPELKPALKSLV